MYVCMQEYVFMPSLISIQMLGRDSEKESLYFLIFIIW